MKLQAYMWFLSGMNLASAIGGIEDGKASWQIAVSAALCVATAWAGWSLMRKAKP